MYTSKPPTLRLLQDTLRAAETAVQLCRRIGAVFSQQWFIHKHKTFRHIIFVCYCHKIRYIIIWHALFKCLYKYTYSQSGCRWYWCIIGGASGHTHWENLKMHHLEAVVVKRWGENAESPLSTLLRTSRNIQTEFIRKSGSGSSVCRNRARRYESTRNWGSMKLDGSTKSRTERVRPKVGKDRVCIFIVWHDEMEMRQCLSTLESAEYILPITRSTSNAPLSLYNYCRTIEMYWEAMIKHGWRCTWGLISSELRDALGDQEIEWTQRCTWWPLWWNDGARMQRVH